MNIIKHFRGHRLRSFVSHKDEKTTTGRCTKCGIIVYSKRQCGSIYFCYLDDSLSSPYSTDISLIPRCEEITMDEALS